jgi:serine/threonine protein kinase
MPPARCPPSADLERLFSGTGPEEEILVLEQHLLECDGCLQTLKTLLDSRETLAPLLRGRPPADLLGDSPVVADLRQCLQSLRTRDGKEGPTAVPRSQPESAPEGEAADQGHDSSLTDFLSPPEAGDELGRLGRYRVLKVLGQGGMGVVYQAEDPLLNRTVAIKAMLPALAASSSAGQRFLREARAMAAVKHDHVVTIYEVNEERGVPFLAMELLAGQALDRRLEAPGELPLAEALRIGREIAEGLGAAHATGLIHRDIKPANVWLEAPRGRVKILDFGVARAAAPEAALTRPGTIIGTPEYMAPEQARGDPVDARSDLFSLGVVLYRLCTGLLPFQGQDTVSTLMEVVLHHPPPPIQLNRALPPELSDLVMRLLEKDPDRRVGTAGEVVAALQGL